MYLVIGSGRAALHTTAYFALKGIAFYQWSRKSNSYSELDPLISKASCILVLISDSQLESFYRDYLSNCTCPIVHFSGALEIRGMKSAHPLMTFGLLTYELGIYEKIAFAVGEGTNFQELFPELTNPTFSVSTKERALYHAWVSYCGNFANLLWREALPGIRELGVPEEALRIYLQQTLTNFFQTTKTSLTGPLARKDSIVVNKHLDVLPEPARSIYQSFVKSYFPEFKKDVQL